MLTLNNITELEEKFQLATYKKMPIVAERGEGCWIYTSDGERYLDLYGGHAVAGTGHCHPHVVKAIKAQADELVYAGPSMATKVRAEIGWKPSRSLAEGLESTVRWYIDHKDWWEDIFRSGRYGGERLGLQATGARGS